MEKLDIHVLGSDQRIVRCARVSFGKDEHLDIQRDKKLIKYLLDNKHMSPFEHVIIAFKADKKNWLDLVSFSADNPTLQIYYGNNYVWLNLRNLMNLLRFNNLPLIMKDVLEYVKNRLPTTFAVLEGKDIDKAQYTLDESYLEEKIETPAGWVGLVSKLELGTLMDHYTFVVECPIFVARQWHRHRFGSYNEVSRRYVSYEPTFYIPEYIRKQSKSNKQASLEEAIEESGHLIERIKNLVSQSLSLYKDIISKDGAREIARGVLPQFMKTRFYWTVPRVSLDNFLSLRTHQHAQKEIREMAFAIKEMVGYKGTDRGVCTKGELPLQNYY